MKCFRDEQQMNHALVTILKDIRINLGLSQPELESKLGVGSEYVSKIERGKIKVSLELLRKYTTVIDTTISSLLERAEKYANIHKQV